MRPAILALSAFAVAVALACSGGGASSGPEVKVTLSDYQFEPNQLSAPANTQVKLTVKNAGSVEHDFTVDRVSYKLLSPTGREVSKTLGPLQPGTYEVICSVAGHKELGMVATLTVK